MARPRRFALDRTKGSIASWNNLCCYIAKFHIAFVFLWDRSMGADLNHQAAPVAFLYHSPAFKCFLHSKARLLENNAYLCTRIIPHRCSLHGASTHTGGQNHEKPMNEITIQQKIYEIRGQRVMLDFDLANAYGVQTAQLKRQVRRNIERFEGEDFMFEVTHDELSRCQIGTLNIKQGQNIKYLPFAFTELGVAINESTRAQLDAISDALTELQSQSRNSHPLPEIGYTAIQKRRKEEENS